MATETDKIDTGALATLVAVGTAAMIGISLAVNALVRSEVGGVQAERDEGGAAYGKLKESQLQKLSGPPAWADDTKSRVSLPIDRAMDLVLADLKKNPWSASPGVPPADAGADAEADAADGGAPDAATADAEAESDAGVPEPPAPPPPRPESSAPMGPPGTPRPPEPSKAPSATAPTAASPRPSAGQAAPSPASPVPAAPAPVAPSAPPATP